MVDSDKIMRRAEQALQNLTPERRQVHKRSISRRLDGAFRKLKRILLANLVLIIGTIGLAFITPIGIEGVLLAVLLMLIVTLVLAVFPRAKNLESSQLGTVELGALPAQTEIWLEKQRPALPRPAVKLVDDIANQLAALEPQLTSLEPNGPAAYEVRKLVGEQLPELISGYTRIPQNLRTRELNGRIPDQQLTEGLHVIRAQIEDMTIKLATGDLDGLATRGRYLELKYGKDASAPE